MGKLKIKFFFEKNEIVDKPPYNMVGLKQKYVERYNILKIEEIEFNREDFEISLELSDITDWFINWDGLEYPNSIVKEKVLSIIYYKGISRKLEDEILNKINLSRFGGTEDIESLTKQAIKIIEETKESGLIPNLEIIKNQAISQLYHTLSKEVFMYKSLKKNSSKKSKDESLDKALEHLNYDIETFRSTLENPEIDNNY